MQTAVTDVFESTPFRHHKPVFVSPSVGADVDEFSEFDVVKRKRRLLGHHLVSLDTVTEK